MASFAENWGSQRGIRFLNTSRVGVRLAVAKLKYREMNQDISQQSLFSQNEGDELEEFVPRAKEGFALALKSDSITREQVSDLLEITTPITIPGIWKSLRLTDKQNTLSEFGQTVTALSILQAVGKVSFYSFAEPPAELSFESGMSESYWFYRTDVEGVWNLLNELEGLTRSLLYSDSISSEDLFKVGHFYMANSDAAKIFKY